MLTLAICDDESFFITSLNEMVNRYLNEVEIEAWVALFSSGEDLLSADNYFDIIFMDIKLPGQNGMKIIETLRQNGIENQVIFITSYREFVYDAFDLDAVHYLVKPITYDKLYQACNKAIKYVKKNDNKTIIISKGSTSQVIYLKDILYCESYDHQIYIYTKAERYSYFGTLNVLQDKLNEHFFRCHRSYIINMNFVVDKGPNTATIIDGTKVLISRRKQHEFTQRLLGAFKKGIIE